MMRRTRKLGPISNYVQQDNGYWGQIKNITIPGAILFNNESMSVVFVKSAHFQRYNNKVLILGEIKAKTVNLAIDLSTIAKYWSYASDADLRELKESDLNNISTCILRSKGIRSSSRWEGYQYITTVNKNDITYRNELYGSILYTLVNSPDRSDLPRDSIRRSVQKKVFKLSYYIYDKLTQFPVYPYEA